MNREPIFESEAQAITVLFHVTRAMSHLWLWLAIATAHVALLVIGLTVVWFLQATPDDVVQAFQRIAASTPVAAYVTLGGSIAAAAGLYWKFVRWVHKASHGGWMLRYLIKDAR